jgi:formate dehydrogenase maturation protein FdhE
MAACQLAYAQCNKTAAFIAADAVDAIVKHYVRLLSRERADRTDQCPRCASRNVRTFFDIAIESDGAYFEACAECGWSENDDEHSGDPVR